jgi:hypothetical protein
VVCQLESKAHCAGITEVRLSLHALGHVRRSFAKRVQVLHELPLIATGTDVGELTAHALRASIGDLCLRRDRAAIAALAANAGVTCPAVVREHFAIVISHGLWTAGPRSSDVQQVSAGMIQFVEQILAEPEPGARALALFATFLAASGSRAGLRCLFCRRSALGCSHVHTRGNFAFAHKLVSARKSVSFCAGVVSTARPLDDHLQSAGVMHCTKLETIYYAAHASRWPASNFADPQQVACCRRFLETLVRMDPNNSTAASAASAAATPIRAILPVETVEFFVQLFGSALIAGAARAQGRVAAVPKASVLPAGLFVSQVLERDPLQSLRAMIVLICLLGPTHGQGPQQQRAEHVLAAHTLKIMAALASGMEAPFAGAVREQAMRGLQHLVRGLVAGANATMLQQVRSRAASRTLAFWLLVVLSGRVGCVLKCCRVRGCQLRCASVSVHELIKTITCR